MLSEEQAYRRGFQQGIQLIREIMPTVKVEPEMRQKMLDEFHEAAAQLRYEDREIIFYSDEIVRRVREL